MIRINFSKKYYPAESSLSSKLENGLIVSTLPKNDFNKVYGVTVYVGSVDTEFTIVIVKKAYLGGLLILEHKLFEEASEDYHGCIYQIRCR